jgi:hypothetical protein
LIEHSNTTMVGILFHPRDQFGNNVAARQPE